MNIIISGVTSFLGFELSKYLLSEGHIVYGIVRESSKSRKKLLELNNDALSGRFIECVLDFDSLKSYDDEVFKSDIENIKTLPKKAEIFIHFSWDGVGSNGRADMFIQRKNIRNSMKALEISRLLDVKKFLFAGSQAEYGRGSHEEPFPISPYGRAKQFFSSKASEYIDKNKLELQFIHMRIYSVYGHGDHETSLINSAIKNFREDSPMELGPCTQLWNYIYIKDLVRAIDILINLDSTNEPYKIYDIAGDGLYPLKDYVIKLREICGSSSELKFGERMNNVEGAVDFAPFIEPLKKLGFKEEYSFEEGIMDMLYIRQTLKNLRS